LSCIKAAAIGEFNTKYSGVDGVETSMRVRLGYVAMSLKLSDCSPSKTITVANLQKLEGEENRLNRLRRITGENLQNTMRLLYYNAAHRISVFRFTSKLVPLATHPLTQGWDYCTEFAGDFAKIGDIVRGHNMRVSSHPDHFTVINTPKEEVFQASLKDLVYHDDVFAAMRLPEAKMVTHVGGMYGSKPQSLQRFKENFRILPEAVRRRLLLENDDKSFGVADVLEVCQELQIPMVVDVHHHNCVNRGEEIGEYLDRIFDTWQGSLPKVHFSSPKSVKKCRAHADDIDVGEFYKFLLTARELGRDFDVMIEAKNKDLAVFNLIRELKGMTGITALDESTIQI